METAGKKSNDTRRKKTEHSNYIKSFYSFTIQKLLEKSFSASHNTLKI